MAWLLRLSAALGAALVMAVPAQGAAPDAKRLDRTVRYLQDVQHRDGGFGERGSDPTFSAWAAFALASAGINPRDQRRPGGVDVYSYLTRNTSDLDQTTDFARVLLVTGAAGTKPQRFGRIDPLRRMLAHQRPDGAFPQRPGEEPAVNAMAFAVLAMAGIERGALDRSRGITATQLRRSSDRALNWLTANQQPDGSWEGTDLTGSVIEALNAAGRRGTPAQARALRYLRSRQNADGGFGQGTPGEASNTASTSWVARALVSAGIAARRWQAGGSGRSPLDYLASMQQSDGSVRHSAAKDVNRVWMTSFTTPALAGTSLPIAAVEREQKAKGEDAKEPESTRGSDGGQAGAGGTAAGGDGEVTAGGGGHGAPLFSRPRPGSKGNQAGGRRDTRRRSRARGEGQGAVAGQSVVGKLVGRGKLAASGDGKALGAAPGLSTAASGGDAPPGLMAAIGVGLLLSAAGGMYLERRPRRGHMI